MDGNHKTKEEVSIVVDNTMVTFKEFLAGDPAEVDKFVEELYDDIDITWEIQNNQLVVEHSDS